MIRIGEILRAYRALNDRLDELAANARSARNQKYWSEMQLLNDHAYFMLVFGRFEQHLDDPCQRLIVKRTGKMYWKRKRLWHELDVDRMRFKQKIALFVEKGRTDYNRIADIYQNIRCPIAHGDNSSVAAFSLLTLASELRILSTKLKAT